MARRIVFKAGKLKVKDSVYKWLAAHKQVASLIVKVTKVTKPKSLKARALMLARKQIGTKERPAGSNKQKYGVWYGANAEPWCAIFVSWVLSHVRRPFKYAYVPYIVNDAKAGKNGLSTALFSQVAAQLKAGNVVLACYDWPGESKGIADHVGFVEKVVNGNSFIAIEGNTTSSATGNQSNGGEVCRKTRYTSDVQAFVVVKPV